MKNAIFLLLIIGFLGSCEKTQKIDDYPKHKSQLVANCLFSEDSVFVFRLYKSLSPLDNAPFKVLNHKNAWVKVYEENVLFDSFVYSSSAGAYVGSWGKKPTTGKNYSFKAYFPGYPIISGSDPLSVPASMSNNSNKLKIKKSYFGADTMPYADYEVTVNLNIDKGSDLKYAVVVIDDQMYANQRYYTDGYLRVDETGNISTAVGQRIFIENQNGIGNIRFGLGKTGFIYMNHPYSTMRVEIYKCSKQTYEYLKRYAIQEGVENDPFAEPIPISNDIQNGFGIFGGLSSTVYEFNY